MSINDIFWIFIMLSALQPVVRQQLMNAMRTRCLLYTSPSPRDRQKSRMPSSA